MAQLKLSNHFISVKGIPSEELESALHSLLNTFDVLSVVIRKQGRGGSSESK